VSLACRLEKTAKDGAIYISDAVQMKVENYVLSREIGRVQLKLAGKPVRIFEPYEISVDLPRKKDPASTRMVQLPGEGPRNEASARPFCSACGRKIGAQQADELRNVYDELKRSFESLNRLMLDVEKGKAPVKAVRTELAARWKKLKRSLETGSSDAAA
jgi:hypothetical protein